ncbi:helix-turn-helix transcriptional regulator [Streptomyces sp. DSM 41269]|uniref:helix-turn-helix transcriptional regulator n=1 Tax=Streptomyces sp. DSM 41269 TaxID=2817709 RepID=UPI0027894D06|nr:helix-turn-helix transcriptional regulator [Streptomyces sp. DSM 41269]MDP9950450.1 DNA-binding CsgD family transcriptional regulator [Streptomyces sp. DSM 41269]
MTAKSGPTVAEDGTSRTPPTGHGPEDGASGTPHPHHGPEELCEPARLLYTAALQRGGVTAAEADRVPCLARLGLLRPDPHDPGRRLPVPAAAALAELLAPLTRDIHARVAASAALVEALAPLAPLTGSSGDPAMTVIQGKPAIQAAVAEAGKAARKRILTLHPGSKRPDAMLEQARQSAIEPLRRGVSMRHLYQHSARYNMNLKQYVDRLPQGDLQIRTMEQTVERMFVFDRSAYISISPERDVALCVTHPALVRYLAHVYDVLWAGATPFGEPLRTSSPDAPVTAVQHSIARLLAAGHVDDDIARRMGISVRTCRSHIARLMQTLGATTRPHLGALLIGSGIVEAHRRD